MHLVYYVAPIGAFFCTNVSAINGLNSTLQSLRTLETVEEISSQNPVNARIAGQKKGPNWGRVMCRERKFSPNVF